MANNKVLHLLDELQRFVRDDNPNYEEMLEILRDVPKESYSMILEIFIQEICRLKDMTRKLRNSMEELKMLIDKLRHLF